MESDTKNSTSKDRAGSPPKKFFSRFWSSKDKKEKKDKDASESGLNSKKMRMPWGRKKGEDDTSGSDPPLETEKMIIHANNFSELPEDVVRKIERARIDKEEIDKHFDILVNVLRFTTKRTIIRDKSKEKKQESTTIDEEKEKDKEKEKEKEPQEKKKRKDVSDSNLTPELLKAAEPTIHYVNPKKLFRKAEFTGKGGFGRVFYAKSSLDKGEKVAVKKMPHTTPKEKRMNLDEIAVLNFCNHPNIVKYYRSYIFDNEASIIMEYMEGGSLSEAAKRFDFDESHIAFIAREICQGISYLHENKLVHRDLKSGNVMLSIKGDIKIIDFGLAISIDKCRVHMVGSPFWMPPEMIQSKPHGFPADVWSFAICLIEMADKKPPNRKARLKAMFTTGTVGLLPYLEESKYSDLFKDFLRQCLQQDPSQRATAQDLLKHPFISKASPQKAMETVLREIFLSNAFENSGFFI